MGARGHEADAYIARSERWPYEVAALRMVLLGCDLSEELKWGKPCSSLGSSNIVIMQEMKAVSGGSNCDWLVG